MKRGRSSLFWRLTALISAVLLAGAAVLAIAASNYARTAADDAYDRVLLGAARQISETLAAENGAVEGGIPVSALEALSASRTARVYYRVAMPAKSEVTGYQDLPLPAGSEAGGTGPYVSNTEFKGRPIRIAAVGRYFAEANGWVMTVVGQTLEARDALARDLTLKAMVLVGLMSLIALTGVIVAIKLALRPLTTIEAALLGRPPNVLTPLDVEAPAEIATLISAINNFMERLAGRLEAMQRFIADSAHQIRTPLTALVGQVELLSGETNAAKRQHHIERVRTRTAELARLTNQLLSDAMISHRAETMGQSEVDVATLAREALAGAVPVSLDRDITVAFDAPQGAVTMRGDAVSLREAFKNVIENAIQHGARSLLRVSVRRSGAGIEVEVGDDGPGIPEALWPQAPQRFFRGRSGGTGSGLGLAIARDVAAHHGGELSFKSEGGIFSVLFTFNGAKAS
ncbi:sensor histidine kinase [Nordella sp. HKS 07]|uniref:sensor histidine kinase n=1 Tax=Nordella sp. HKS 07 TaxID=2712222 RepID=UPI0013E1CAD7|nr:sensor histidine kinase [Nordella sp. HKS 07]QIG46423.1 sensor histidine kinase [Nordella sp. HKS 07]